MKKIYPLPALCKYGITSLFLLLTHVLPAQTITTIAGGSIGEGKPATSIGMTVFWHQTWNVLAIDAADNLYIVDNNTLRVRKVSATTGIITTVAGNGNTYMTGDGQPATNVGLGAIFSIALDRLGNIYLGTIGRIRKVNAATGIINTIAGTGSTGFSGDSGLATLAKLTAASSIRR